MSEPLVKALEAILALCRDREAFVLQGPRAFARAEAIAKEALAAHEAQREGKVPVSATLPAWNASFELPSGAVLGLALPLGLERSDYEALARKLERIASVVRKGGLDEVESAEDRIDELERGSAKRIRVYLIGYATPNIASSTPQSWFKAADGADMRETMPEGWPIGESRLIDGKSYVCVAHELSGKVAVVEEGA